MEAAGEQGVLGGVVPLLYMHISFISSSHERKGRNSAGILIVPANYFALFFHSFFGIPDPNNIVKPRFRELLKWLPEGRDRGGGLLLLGTAQAGLPAVVLQQRYYLRLEINTYIQRKSGR